MTDRFVVIPVGKDDEAPGGGSDDPVAGSGGSEGDNTDPQDAVPILEYSREPNKYGKDVPQYAAI